MPLTFDDLFGLDKETVVLTGAQIREFETVIQGIGPNCVDHARVLEGTKDAAKITGHRYRSLRDQFPGTLIGIFGGRGWYAEKAKRIDWGSGDHGLNIGQLQFLRGILRAVRAEFWNGEVYVDAQGRTVEPESLARFEQMLVDALHAYDSARTERLNFLEGEYREMIERSTVRPVMTLWPGTKYGGK